MVSLTVPRDLDVIEKPNVSWKRSNGKKNEGEILTLHDVHSFTATVFSL